MSCNYADGLSPYENKGVLGRKEKFDSPEDVSKKTSLLTEWIQTSKYVVIHTGAGISTSAGIPDFRSPNGVWTLEKKGMKPTFNISFDDAKPTLTHMALYTLVKLNKVKYVISQNIDGLHLKSGLPRDNLAELHGNMFVDQCATCRRQFVRNTATTSVGQKNLNVPCKGKNSLDRICRGKLHDTILDWEHNLPETDLYLSELHSSAADLSICLGTTLQINPSGKLPLYVKKNNGRLVIINLQPTKYDKKADLIINTYVDDVFSLLMKNLNIDIMDYTIENDPTKRADQVIEWTIKYDIKNNKTKNKSKKRKSSADESDKFEKKEEKRTKEKNEDNQNQKSILGHSGKLVLKEEKSNSKYYSTSVDEETNEKLNVEYFSTALNENMNKLENSEVKPKYSSNSVDKNIKETQNREESGELITDHPNLTVSLFPKQRLVENLNNLFQIQMDEENIKIQNAEDGGKLIKIEQNPNLNLLEPQMNEDVMRRMAEKMAN